MAKEKEVTHVVQKQTLYIAVLVAVTLGFLAGASYTSFKLAGAGGRGQAAVKDPHAGSQADAQARAEASVGAEILKLETFLKENPENAGAWVRLGNLFFDTNRFGDAIDAYEKSLTIAPGDPNVLTDLGVMYRRNKLPEKAVGAFDRAIAARPDFETARFNKGIVLMHDLNDLPGATQAWKELVKINPLAQAPGGRMVADLVRDLERKAK
ncbi:MAG: tetratricopeptide repeat protein [Desulfobacter sp.]|nr:MAG: tetratricopeptide repeat protein [Desulfobacter sp.]